MISQDKHYNDIIKGEIEIIHEELDNLIHNPYTVNIGVLPILENVTPHLASIEQKIGKSSIDHINISTEIVDVISNRILDYIESCYSDSLITNLSAQETVKLYANQRENLTEGIRICRKLESMNMDYAYRVKIFNTTKKEIENRCNKKGIDTRTSTQKSIDNLKTVGAVTGVIAKETAGCAIGLVIKVAIVIVIFLILMAIFGVK